MCSVTLYCYDYHQANEEAEVVVLSSCPCNRYVNYVVTTEGHVAIWQKYKPVVHMTKIMDQVDICRFNLTYVPL